MTLMAEGLEQTCQWHEIYCHDLEVMSLNPGSAELGLHSTSVLSRTWTKNNITTVTTHSCAYRLVRGAALTSSTASTLKCSPSWPSRSCQSSPLWPQHHNASCLRAGRSSWNGRVVFSSPWTLAMLAVPSSRITWSRCSDPLLWWSLTPRLLLRSSCLERDSVTQR